MASGSDAFKDRLAEAQVATGRPELAHQSVGRAITAEEHALAEAMMEAYGAGALDLAQVATALTKKGVVAPVSGKTAWDADLLATELKAANETLDATYQTHGYGA